MLQNAAVKQLQEVVDLWVNAQWPELVYTIS
jgi:hypothetical protein